MVNIFSQEPSRILRIAVFNPVWKSDKEVEGKSINSDTSDTSFEPLCMSNKEEDNNHANIYKTLKEPSALSETTSIADDLSLEAKCNIPTPVDKQITCYSKIIGEHYKIAEDRTTIFIESGVVYTQDEIDALMKHKGSSSLKFIHEAKKAINGRIITEVSKEEK